MDLPPQFYEWFNALCRECGVEEPQQVIDAGGLQFGDVIVAVNPSLARQGSEHLLFQSPLGWLPDGCETLLRRLLEIQLLIAGPSAPTFGVALSTDVVVVSVAIKPDEVDAAAGAQMVRSMVALVMRLRDELGMETQTAKERAEAATGAKESAA